MDLNEEQQEAKQHTEGALLIVAGAGSGKTRVLVERIVHLLEKGVHPSEILALTFTNKAAAQMKERICRQSALSVRAMTFHSFGAMVLRQCAEKLSLSPDFTIYDSQESEQVLRAALESLDLPTEKSYLAPYKEMISHFKNRLVDEKQIAEHKGQDPLFPKIYAAYQSKLQESKALDFDDLLLLTYKFLQSDAGKTYAAQWRYLLVDEYQDTNHAQYQIVLQLALSHGNLCVVGDPDQSIYSWRGADITNILRFQKDFPHAKQVTLRMNYRSSPHILKAANSLISHNRERLPKELIPQAKEGKKVSVSACFDDREEALFTASRIKRAHLLDHIPLNECAILYRTNAQSRLLEEALLKQKIPYIIYGGLSFYQRKEIKDLIAFLKVFIQPFDYLSFERTFLLEKRGVGKASLAKLIPHGIPILDHLALLTGQKSCTPKQRKAFIDYLAIFEGLHNLKHSPYLFLQKILERTGYEAQLRAEDPHAFDDRKENIGQLLRKTQEWEKERAPGLTALDFLQEISLISSSDDQSGLAVQMMTLHNAKGLEFEFCILTGLEEELFPHANSIHSKSQLEEERRLCYVGMTRAKRELILTYAKQRFLWGTARRMSPSRFLNEIDPSCCTILGTEPQAASTSIYRSSFFHRDEDF